MYVQASGIYYSLMAITCTNKRQSISQSAYRVQMTLHYKRQL